MKVGKSFHHNIQGAVLLISIIFLLLISLLSITMIQTTLIDEQMASNYFNRQDAFSAAEAALIEAERQIATGTYDNAALFPSSGCSAGLCVPNVNNPVWKDNVWGNSKLVPNVQIQNASATDNACPANASPCFIIERLTSSGNPSIVGSGGHDYRPPPNNTSGIYRITALAEKIAGSGQKQKQKVRVMLQSVYGNQ